MDLFIYNVLIIFLLDVITLSFVLTTEPSEISCRKLHDHIQIAENETNFGQTQFIHDHNYSHDYIYSDVFLKLSKFASELLLKGDSGQFRNLNPELREYSQCIRQYLNSVCTPNNAIKCPLQLYRSVDGICSNLHAAKDGSSGTSYSSIFYPQYDDAVTEIQRSIIIPYDLPSPRLISTTFFTECKNTSEIYKEGPSQGGVMFGQLIAHDISMGADPADLPNGFRKCCKDDRSGSLPKLEQDENCAPIIVPQRDYVHSESKRFCFNMIRLKNVYDNDCNLAARKPMNLQTASPDLSIIYGPTQNQSRVARIFKSGLLFDNKKRIFFSFDLRAGQTPQLAVLHTIMIRQHNRLANLLARVRINWSDEKLYQTTRRYVIAMYQNIIYNEWLPIFMDKKYIKLRFSRCNKNTLSSTVEFAHSMFRHQHTFLPPTFQLYNTDHNISMELKLSDNIGRVDLLNDFYDEIIRGLFLQPINFNGCFDELINRLFKDGTGIGIDLLAVDIQRARETGVQGYTSYASVCLGKNIYNFEDLAPEISSADINKLQHLYESVFDIDLYIGAKLEIVKQKFKFGPTLSCIIGDQFARYKYCDRYFYDNENNPKPFRLRQLREIEKVTFARLLCDNTNIKRVSRHAFRTAHNLVDCDQINKVNIFLL